MKDKMGTRMSALLLNACFNPWTKKTGLWVIISDRKERNRTITLLEKISADTKDNEAVLPLNSSRRSNGLI